MNKAIMYFKGLDKNLKGYNGFQYKIGGTFSVDTDDPWEWLFFAIHIETAVFFGQRIVEIEPVNNIYTQFGQDNLCAKAIRIIREIPLIEILARLALRTLKKKEMRFYLDKLGMLSHDGPHKNIIQIPITDVIPVAWLEAHSREYYEEWGTEPVTVENALREWRKEQEASK